MGENDSYFIPIAGLPEILNNQNEGKPALNHYYIENNTEDFAYLKKGEINHLIDHSPLTKKLYKINSNYCTLLKSSQGNLLSELQTLCRALMLNSANLRGLEKHAGSEIYGPIIDFNQFFKSLSPAQIAEIPEELLNEINLLLEISTDKDVNREARENAESCIATRRDKIIENMKFHEEKLVTITLNKPIEDKNFLEDKNLKNDSQELQEALLLYQETEKKLKDALDQGNYQNGHDGFELTLKTLNWLDIHPSNSDIEDFEFLSHLKEGETAKVIRKYHLHGEMIKPFSDLQEMLSFCLNAELPVLRKTLFLRSTGLPKENSITIKFICDASAALEEERAFILWEAFKESIPKLIKNPSDLSYLIRRIPEKYIGVISNQLFSFIKKPDDLGWFLRSKDSATLKKLPKTQWNPVIRSGFDLVILIQDLVNYPSIQDKILNGIEEQKLNQLLQYPSRLNSLLSYLKGQECRKILPLVKKYHPHNFYTLTQMLQGLSFEQSKAVLSVCNLENIFQDFEKDPAKNIRYMKGLKNETLDSLKKAYLKIKEKQFAQLITLSEKLPDHEEAKALSNALKTAKGQLGGYMAGNVDKKSFDNFYEELKNNKLALSIKDSSQWRNYFLTKLNLFFEKFFQCHRLLQTSKLSKTLELGIFSYNFQKNILKYDIHKWPEKENKAAENSNQRPKT